MKPVEDALVIITGSAGGADAPWTLPDVSASILQRRLQWRRAQAIALPCLCGRCTLPAGEGCTLCCRVH